MRFLPALLLCTLPLSAAPKVPADEHFKVETLASGFVDAMEIAITPDDLVYVIERTGGVKLVRPSDGKIHSVANIDVEVRSGSHARESGLLGIALDPNYATNKWVYLYYSVPEVSKHRLARFTFAAGHLSDEKTILEVPADRERAVCHEAGSLAFGPEGNLFLSTGDNTCPFESDGYAPLDERKGREEFDAQRSAANTTDLRGKILRIKPTPLGGYEIPEGNLFAEGEGRPEIYVMGCRNPYRISIDQQSGFLYWGEVGPDGGADNKDRGPRGYDEINQAKRAGNFGWPYFIADNKGYSDFDFATSKSGAPNKPAAPKNPSPNNTGARNLPPAQPAFWFYPRASACAGPVFHHADYPENPAKLPEELDSCLIIYDWTSAWLRLIKLDAAGKIVFNEPWLGKYRFIHPSDMALDSKGRLYLLEYGSAWYDGKDGNLKRITYSTTQTPIEIPADDPRMKGLPKTHAGTKLIGASTCLACHTTEQKSIGPAYKEVANKYRKDGEAATRLAVKIRAGGVGVWGEIPMPAHPQVEVEEAQQMIEAILATK